MGTEPELRWVENTEVERREDGVLVTFWFADGTCEQHYLAPSDVVDLQTQLYTALGATS